MAIKKQTKMWTQRNGTKIRICDMSDSHLINAIHMVKRQATKLKQENTGFYLSCPMPRGEAAMDAFESEFDTILDSDWTDFANNILDSLVLDAERRNIQDKIYW